MELPSIDTLVANYDTWKEYYINLGESLVKAEERIKERKDFLIVELTLSAAIVANPSTPQATSQFTESPAILSASSSADIFGGNSATLPGPNSADGDSNSLVNNSLKRPNTVLTTPSQQPLTKKNTFNAKRHIDPEALLLNAQHEGPIYHRRTYIPPTDSAFKAMNDKERGRAIEESEKALGCSYSGPLWRVYDLGRQLEHHRKILLEIARRNHPRLWAGTVWNPVLQYLRISEDKDRIYRAIYALLLKFPRMLAYRITIAQLWLSESRESIESYLKANTPERLFWSTPPDLAHLVPFCVHPPFVA